MIFQSIYAGLSMNWGWVPKWSQGWSQAKISHLYLLNVTMPLAGLLAKTPCSPSGSLRLIGLTALAHSLESNSGHKPFYIERPPEDKKSHTVLTCVSLTHCTKFLTLSQLSASHVLVTWKLAGASKAAPSMTNIDPNSKPLHLGLWTHTLLVLLQKGGWFKRAAAIVMCERAVNDSNAAANLLWL